MSNEEVIDTIFRFFIAVFGLFIILPMLLIGGLLYVLGYSLRIIFAGMLTVGYLIGVMFIYWIKKTIGLED